MPRTKAPVDPALKYAREVVARKRVAGPYVRAACERHLADLEREDVWYDRDAADRVSGFYREVLVLKDGQFDGLPFVLDLHQEFIIRSLFGWKRCGEGDDPADKTTWRRRFRRAYVEMGKGNGKSPLLAGVGVYGLMADGERGAQIYVSAATRDQARVIFDDAVHMIRECDALRERVLFAGINPVTRIAEPRTGGMFKPLSREQKRSGSGLRPHIALVDELHEHPDRDHMEMLERGFKFRRQPLMVMATNSGSDRNSVCYEEHTQAVKVATGMIEDDSTFAFVCCLDEKDDPLKDPKVWAKANPLLGKVITREYLEGVVKQARQIVGRRNNVMRLHFCQWTDSHTAWIAHHAWIACEDPELREEDFHGRRYWAGLDLSATTDLTAYVRLYEDGTDARGRPRFAGFATAYMPEQKIQERVREDRVAYDVWVHEGHLVACPGARILYEQVAADVIADTRRAKLEAVAYDKYLYNHFEDAVLNLGADLPAHEHPQGYLKRRDSELWMPGSIDEMETLILERRVRFAPSPALRSAIASATLDISPAGLRKFAKQKATARIDCAVAAAMACGVATASGLNPLLSYYETETAVAGSMG